MREKGYQREMEREREEDERRQEIRACLGERARDRPSFKNTLSRGQ